MADNIRIVLAATTLFAGCASYDGTYEPACIAYAGDEIRLQDGRFYWDKFTDQVLIGKDGAVVDQFPDHPAQGTFRIEGNRLLLRSDAGKSLDDWYLLEDDGRTYLLNARQYADWNDSGQYPACALVSRDIAESP